MSTTPSSAHQAGPLCLKCPNSFLEAKAGLGLGSSLSFPPCSFPRLRNLREGYVSRRTGEGACLFGYGLNLWEEKVQEPLKEKRVCREIICRTGESQRRRKVGRGDIITSWLPWTVSCPLFLKFYFNSTKESASLAPPSPVLALAMNPLNSVCMITAEVWVRRVMNLQLPGHCKLLTACESFWPFKTICTGRAFWTCISHTYVQYTLAGSEPVCTAASSQFSPFNSFTLADGWSTRFTCSSGVWNDK